MSIPPTYAAQTLGGQAQINPHYGAHAQTVYATPATESRAYFSVAKVDNGYVVYCGERAYIAKDMDDILDAVKLVMVTQTLT